VLLSYSKEQNSSLEAHSPKASQETFCSSWNMKFRYHVCKGPLLVPVLCQMNSVHTLQSCLFKPHYNTLIPSASCFKVVSFLQVSSQNLVRIFFSYVHAVCISHRILIDMITAIISGVCTGHEHHCAVASSLLLHLFRARYLPEEPFIKKSRYILILNELMCTILRVLLH